MGKASGAITGPKRDICRKKAPRVDFVVHG
jgi:hypothetical protein